VQETLGEDELGDDALVFSPCKPPQLNPLAREWFSPISSNECVFGEAVVLASSRVSMVEAGSTRGERGEDVESASEGGLVFGEGGGFVVGFSLRGGTAMKAAPAPEAVIIFACVLGAGK
jgi:hypothetical protein